MRRILPLIFCCMLILAGYTGSNVNSSKFVQVAYSTGMQTNSSDIWINLSLLTWQADTEVDWDADGTDFDPQFRICFDVDGETDGISEVCEFTQIWQDLSLLSSALNLSFDVPEEYNTVLFTIECYDNDDESDEWNDGPDACDLNELDNAWKLLIEINSTSAGTYEFNGSGYGDSNSQGSKGDGNISVIAEVVHYEDSDGDGIADQFDECNQTPPNRKIASNGCWWLEGDIDGDGIINPEDGCHGLPGSCSLGPQYIIEGEILNGYSWFHPNGEIVQSSGALAPDGSFSLSWRVDTTSKGTHNSYLHAAALTAEGLAEEILLEKFMGLRMVYAKFVQDSFLVIVGDGTISEIQLGSFHDVLDGAANNLQKNDLTVFDEYDGCAYLSVNPSQTRVVLPCIDSEGFERALLYDTELGTISDLSISVPRSQDDTEWLSDRHFLMNEIVLDVLTGTTQDLTQNPGYVSKGWASGYTNFPGLIYEMGNGEYTFANPITGDLIFSLKGCPHASCYAPDHYLKISPNGERILIGNDGNSLSQSVGYLDSDLDMVPDYRDTCNNTPLGLDVNANGCSQQETDSDADGIKDMSDDCPNTLQNANVNSDGCAPYQLDDDLDGVANDIDDCINTPLGESVSVFGCSSTQVDSDEDGVYDSQDDCPSTPSGVTVDSTGCAPDDVVDLDSDGDGVRDSVDACPNSATGIIVDQTGCEVEKQINEENDATENVSGEESFSTILCGGCCFILILLAIGSSSTEEDGKDKSVLVKPVVGLSSNFTEETDPEHEEWLKSFFEELGLNDSHEDDGVSLLEEKVNSLEENLSHLEIESELEKMEMQEEIQNLKQRVIDSEKEKSQLKQEIEEVRIQADESINLQDSVVGGDVVSSGGQKIESQTNITGIDPDTLERILDRERQTAKEIARMEEELARLRGERR